MPRSRNTLTTTERNAQLRAQFATLSIRLAGSVGDVEGVVQEVMRTRPVSDTMRAPVCKHRSNVPTRASAREILTATPATAAKKTQPGSQWLLSSSPSSSQKNQAWRDNASQSVKANGCTTTCAAATSLPAVNKSDRHINFCNANVKNNNSSSTVDNHAGHNYLSATNKNSDTVQQRHLMRNVYRAAAHVSRTLLELRYGTGAEVTMFMDAQSRHYLHQGDPNRAGMISNPAAADYLQEQVEVNNRDTKHVMHSQHHRNSADNNTSSMRTEEERRLSEAAASRSRKCNGEAGKSSVLLCTKTAGLPASTVTALEEAQRYFVRTHCGGVTGNNYKRGGHASKHSSNAPGFSRNSASQSHALSHAPDYTYSSNHGLAASSILPDAVMGGGGGSSNISNTYRSGPLAVAALTLEALRSDGAAYSLVTETAREVLRRCAERSSGSDDDSMDDSEGYATHVAKESTTVRSRGRSEMTKTNAKLGGHRRRSRDAEFEWLMLIKRARAGAADAAVTTEVRSVSDYAVPARLPSHNENCESDDRKSCETKAHNATINEKSKSGDTASSRKDASICEGDDKQHSKNVDGRISSANKKRNHQSTVSARDTVSAATTSEGEGGSATAAATALEAVRRAGDTAMRVVAFVHDVGEELAKLRHSLSQLYVLTRAANSQGDRNNAANEARLQYQQEAMMIAAAAASSLSNTYSNTSHKSNFIHNYLDYGKSSADSDVSKNNVSATNTNNTSANKGDNGSNSNDVNTKFFYAMSGSGAISWWSSALCTREVQRWTIRANYHTRRAELITRHVRHLLLGQAITLNECAAHYYAQMMQLRSSGETIQARRAHATAATSAAAAEIQSLATVLATCETRCVTLQRRLCAAASRLVASPALGLPSLSASPTATNTATTSATSETDEANAVAHTNTTASDATTATMSCHTAELILLLHQLRWPSTWTTSCKSHAEKLSTAVALPPLGVCNADVKRVLDWLQTHYAQLDF